jgi:hypothetical protein
MNFKVKSQKRMAEALYTEVETYILSISCEVKLDIPG